MPLPLARFLAFLALFDGFKRSLLSALSSSFIFSFSFRRSFFVDFFLPVSESGRSSLKRGSEGTVGSQFTWYCKMAVPRG